TMLSSAARVASASASSIFAMAKPTWISTQSPTCTLSESRSATLIVRLTPTTSTVATSGRSPPTATTRPGIARHTSSHPLDLHVANDLGHLDRQRDCEANAQREHHP